jgi:hypothetical protein
MSTRNLPTHTSTWTLNHITILPANKPSSLPWCKAPALCDRDSSPHDELEFINTTVKGKRYSQKRIYPAFSPSVRTSKPNEQPTSLSSYRSRWPDKNDWLNMSSNMTTTSNSKKIKIIFTKSCYMDWFISETADLELWHSKLNREDGLILSRSWKVFFHALKVWMAPGMADMLTILARTKNFLLSLLFSIFFSLRLWQGGCSTAHTIMFPLTSPPPPLFHPSFHLPPYPLLPNPTQFNFWVPIFISPTWFVYLACNSVNFLLNCHLVISDMVEQNFRQGLYLTNQTTPLELSGSQCAYSAQLSYNVPKNSTVYDYTTVK